jgi:hypothetical protein
MNGKYEGYYWNIISAKEEKERKIREQKVKERNKIIAQRLNKPLFKPGRRTMTRGSGIRVSVSAGIKGLWGTI